jgi:peptidoglycan/xylan/chitin deacetylase (PgdA/CDA1 family)
MADRRRRPPSNTHLRRRVMAIAIAAGFVGIITSLAVGENGGPLGRPQAKITGASPAKLPWRQPVGAAGPLDPDGHPTLAAQRAAVAHYVKLGKPIFCTPGRGRYASLTFDDGPTERTGKILDLLRGGGVHTTYFLIGRSAADNLDAVQRQDREGGGVADHTWTHADLTKLSPVDRNNELARTQKLLEQAVGQPITLFRPPYGATDAAVSRAAIKLGLLEILWSVDSRDSLGADQTGIVANVEAGMAPGAIILMHETYDRSLAALPTVLSDAKKKQIRLVSIPELLTLDPPSDAMIRDGGIACSDPAKYRADAASTMRLGGQPVT